MKHPERVEDYDVAVFLHDMGDRIANAVPVG
jgi:hypothetical protein